MRIYAFVLDNNNIYGFGIQFGTLKICGYTHIYYAVIETVMRQNRWLIVLKCACLRQRKQKYNYKVIVETKGNYFYDDGGNGKRSYWSA